MCIHKGSLNEQLFPSKDLFKWKAINQAGSVFITNTVYQDAAAVAFVKKSGAKFGSTPNMDGNWRILDWGKIRIIGTPDNPINPCRITGGSTSVVAASVAVGAADARIGYGYGWFRCGIPAAFVVTGF